MSRPIPPIERSGARDRTPPGLGDARTLSPRTVPAFGRRRDVDTTIDPTAIHELGRDELDGWDAATVDVPGGDLYQSRIWAEYRARHGWRPRFLALPDGSRVLALVRPWPWIGGGGAYVSRGPVAAGTTPQVVADRLIAVSRWLAREGVDAVSADPAIPVGRGYEERLAAAGFRPIEEIQPSRHRMVVRVPVGADDEALIAALDGKARGHVRGAIKRGIRTVRYDLRTPADPGEGVEAPPAQRLEEAANGALERLYEMLALTAARRGFALGARAPFLDWGRTGLTAGRILVLEMLSPKGETLAAGMFYRHGGMLTYSHSSDRMDIRRAWPGVAHLQLWRALQIARDEGIPELDLGGVDVRGARRPPVEGEPMWGLYTFKRSFKPEWVDLVGNREWVARPWRYALGRATGRLAATAARLDR